MMHPKKSFKEKAHRQRVEKKHAQRRDKRKAAARSQHSASHDARETRGSGMTLSRMLRGLQANKRGTGSALKQKKVAKQEAVKAAFEAARDAAKAKSEAELAKGSPQP